MTLVKMRPCCPLEIKVCKNNPLLLVSFRHTPQHFVATKTSELLAQSWCVFAPGGRSAVHEACSGIVYILSEGAASVGKVSPHQPSQVFSVSFSNQEILGNKSKSQSQITLLYLKAKNICFCLYFNVFCPGDEGADPVFNFTCTYLADLNCCREKEMLSSELGIT